jgi:uncharacterized protein (DUF1697 family)
MRTYISLLRGINVSGRNPVKMKTLQAIYESLGFSKVITYIQSGNVVFGSEPAEAEELEQRISSGIFRSFGFEVPVLVLDPEILKKTVSMNPFLPSRAEEISRLHLTFLSSEPDKCISGSLISKKYLPDEFLFMGKVVYLYCPGGYGNTKLTNNFFEKKWNITATTRSWKTILELLRISEPR